MVIKCGRREINVTDKDLIMDNGRAYVLLSHDAYVSKALFKKLLKAGAITLTNKKYKGIYGTYDLYGFKGV